MKKENIGKYIVLLIALAINVFIIVNGFIEGTKSSEISGSVSKVIEDGINAISPGTVTEANRAPFKLFTRKMIGHFCLCGLSGIFSTLSFYLFLKNSKLSNSLFSILFSLVFGFAISGLSELAQFTAEGRFPSFADVGIDFAGYVLGLLLIVIIMLVARSSALKNDEKKQA